MILQCSNCNARFLVPDSAIGVGGRTVRCSRCQNTWFEKPITPSSVAIELPPLDEMLGSINQSASEPPSVKPLAKGANLPSHVIHPHSSLTLKLMAASLLLLVSLGGGYIAHPELFLPTSKGLSLADVKFNKQTNSHGALVELSGNILNTSDAEQKVPNLRIVTLNSGGIKTAEKDLVAEGKTLAPEESIPFSTDIQASSAEKLVLDLGAPLELSLRRKP